jgi:hypothetical protein
VDSEISNPLLCQVRKHDRGITGFAASELPILFRSASGSPSVKAILAQRRAGLGADPQVSHGHFSPAVPTRTHSTVLARIWLQIFSGKQFRITDLASHSGSRKARTILAMCAAVSPCVPKAAPPAPGKLQGGVGPRRLLSGPSALHCEGAWTLTSNTWLELARGGTGGPKSDSDEPVRGCPFQGHPVLCRAL